MENENFHIKVQETLRSLDGIQRAEANPFLLTRVLEKMQTKVSSFVKPVLIWQVVASLLMVAILNITIGIYSLNHLKTDSRSSESGYFSNHLYNY